MFACQPLSTFLSTPDCTSHLIFQELFFMLFGKLVGCLFEIPGFSYKLNFITL